MVLLDELAARVDVVLAEPASFDPDLDVRYTATVAPAPTSSTAAAQAAMIRPFLRPGGGGGVDVIQGWLGWGGHAPGGPATGGGGAG